MLLNVRLKSFYLFVLCFTWSFISICDTRSLVSPLNTSISHSVLGQWSPFNGGQVNHHLVINPWFGNGLLSSFMQSTRDRQSDENYVGNSSSISIDDRPVWGESNLGSNKVTSEENNVPAKNNNSISSSNKRDTQPSDIQSDDRPVWNSNNQISNELAHQEPTVTKNPGTFSDERDTLTNASELDDRPVWGESLTKVEDLTSGPEEDILQGVSFEYSGSLEADVVTSIDFVNPRTFPMNESEFVENKASANIKSEANPQGEANMDEHGMLKNIPTSLTKVVVTKSLRYCLSQCTYPDAVPYIYGGNNAGLNEFPHMTALGYGSEEVRNRFPVWSNCGGTLISKNYVLTAAHCTDSSWGVPTVVRIGEHDLSRKDEGSDPVDHSISRIIVHPDYQSGVTLYNDIALLELTTPVNFTKQVRPACLFNNIKKTENFDLQEARTAVATGWGNMGFADAPSDILQKVTLDLINNTECKKYHRVDSYNPSGIIESQLCAGVLAGGKDTCVGDSGGPLQVMNTVFSPSRKCPMEIIGITSFGKFCGEKGSPGVYTSVAHFVPWIEDIVWPTNKTEKLDTAKLASIK